MVNPSDFKNGMTIEWEGELWVVVEFQHGPLAPARSGHHFHGQHLARQGREAVGQIVDPRDVEHDAIGDVQTGVLAKVLHLADDVAQIASAA